MTFASTASSGAKPSASYASSLKVPGLTGPDHLSRPARLQYEEQLASFMNPGDIFYGTPTLLLTPHHRQVLTDRMADSTFGPRHREVGALQRNDLEEESSDEEEEGKEDLEDLAERGEEGSDDDPQDLAESGEEEQESEEEEAAPVDDPDPAAPPNDGGLANANAAYNAAPEAPSSIRNRRLMRKEDFTQLPPEVENTRGDWWRSTHPSLNIEEVAYTWGEGLSPKELVTKKEHELSKKEHIVIKALEYSDPAEVPPPPRGMMGPKEGRELQDLIKEAVIKKRVRPASSPSSASSEAPPAKAARFSVSERENQPPASSDGSTPESGQRKASDREGEDAEDWKDMATNAVRVVTPPKEDEKTTLEGELEPEAADDSGILAYDGDVDDVVQEEIEEDHGPPQENGVARPRGQSDDEATDDDDEEVENWQSVMMPFDANGKSNSTALARDDDVVGTFVWDKTPPEARDQDLKNVRGLMRGLRDRTLLATGSPPSRLELQSYAGHLMVEAMKGTYFSDENGSTMECEEFSM